MFVSACCHRLALVHRAVAVGIPVEGAGEVEDARLDAPLENAGSSSSL